MEGQLSVQMMDGHMRKGAVMTVDTADNLMYHATQFLHQETWQCRMIHVATLVPIEQADERTSGA